MTSKTILYLLHDVQEHGALFRAVKDARDGVEDAVRTNKRNPCEATKREVEIARQYHDRLVRLLQRYEGSLAAVGK